MPNDDAPAAAPLTCTVSILNQRGLHARAAAKLVKLLDRFDAEVNVRKGELTASGRSIMGLMMLAAAPGAELELFVTGPQAQTALAALMELIERKFDEND